MRAHIFYLAIIGVLVILLLFTWNCNRQEKCPDSTRSEAADTALHRDKDSSNWYKPVAVSKTDPKPVPPPTISRPWILQPVRVDSFIEFRNVDTAAILKDYHAIRFYSDPHLTRYGIVEIQDSVSQNKIIARRVHSDFTIPVITKTVTVTEQAKARGQLYLGLNLQGNKSDLLSAAGASLMFKTKRDKVYEAGAQIGMDGRLVYQAGLKFKISLKR